MIKPSREKSKAILDARKAKMTDAASTARALKDGKDTILFGVEREEDGYRVVVYYVLDGKLVDKKVGASQLKHHCIAMVESYISGFVIDSYNDPIRFFDTVVLR